MVNDCPHAQSVHHNMWRFFADVAKRSPHTYSDVGTWEGFDYVCSGLPHPLFNFIVVDHHNQDRLIGQLPHAVSHFTQLKVPFTCWWLPEQEPSTTLHAAFQELGFQCPGTYHGLWLDLTNFTDDAASSLIQIEPVRSQKDYQTFNALFASIFHASPGLKQGLYHGLQCWDQNTTLQHHLAYYQGHPVATISSYQQGQVMGVYNAGTRPDVRRQGIGGSLLRHVIRQAMAQQCHRVAAQIISGDMTKGLLAQLGFQVSHHFLPFIKARHISSIQAGGSAAIIVPEDPIPTHID